MIGIYEIKSSIKSDRVYIGSSKDIIGRWNTHVKLLSKGKHHSIKLQRHYNKYGKEDLSFSILLECNIEDLIREEQFFIDLYNPYFNICKTAYSKLGCKSSKITRNKLKGNKNAAGNKGRIPWNKGLKGIIKDSKETKEKKSKAAVGKHHRIPTLESRIKMSKSHSKHGKYAKKELT